MVTERRHMIDRSLKVLSALVVGSLMLQSAGCGTIMYPNRRGQRGGQIDAGVAILDGIGLLFFIIPGVIAFAVDFNNGAIYLPSGGRGLLNRNDLEKSRFDRGVDAQAAVEKVLREKTGMNVRLADAQAVELASVDELPARFAGVSFQLQSHEN